MMKKFREIKCSDVHVFVDMFNKLSVEMIFNFQYYSVYEVESKLYYFQYSNVSFS